MVMRKTIEHAPNRDLAMALSIWRKSLQETSQFTNGTVSPGIYEHKNNLAGCVQILGNFKSYQEFSI